MDEQRILRIMREMQPADLLTMKDKGRRAGLLWHAAWQRLPQVVEELLRLRANVGARCGTRIGQTALWEASSQGDAAITAMLIDAGADVNVCTWEGAKPGSPGISALGMAQQRGNVDVVQLLIAAGAQG